MKFVPIKVSTGVARSLLHTKKNSPTVLFVAGVTGVVASTVLACKATLKLDEVLDETKKNLTKAEELHTLHQETGGNSPYNDQDYKKDLVTIRVRAALNVGKLYGPSLLVGIAAVGALAGSHNILSKRNAALTAAYAAIDKSFREYRDRIREEFGEDRENAFMYPLEKCEIEDEETGKKKIVKLRTSEGGSIYARFFGRDNKNWATTPDYNIVFLRCQQNWANDRLNARGHVFLNEVYDDLGLERSKEGAVVGWFKGSEGDNYIDFGIFESRENNRLHDFIHGRDGGIWLDFNVDGVIYDKI